MQKNKAVVLVKDFESADGKRKFLKGSVGTYLRTDRHTKCCVLEMSDKKNIHVPRDFFDSVTEAMPA